MSESSNAGTSGGVGFAGLLGIAFIVLKLCHVIDWHWGWVLAPIWIPVAFILLVVAFVLVGTFIDFAFKRRR
jgi:hypothetical protein